MEKVLLKRIRAIEKLLKEIEAAELGGVGTESAELDGGMAGENDGAFYGESGGEVADVAGAGESCGDAGVRCARLEDWLDAQDVMQLLHISRRTMYTLKNNGTLPYSFIQGKIYFLRQDVERVLMNNYKMYKIHAYGRKG